MNRRSPIRLGLGQIHRVRGILSRSSGKQDQVFSDRRSPNTPCDKFPRLVFGKVAIENPLNKIPLGFVEVVRNGEHVTAVNDGLPRHFLGSSRTRRYFA